MQTVTLEFLGAEMEVGYTWPSSEIDDLEIESATIGGVDVAPMIEELARRAARWAGAGSAGVDLAGDAVFDALAEAVASEVEVMYSVLAFIPDEIRARSGREVSTMWAAA